MTHSPNGHPPHQHIIQLAARKRVIRQEAKLAWEKQWEKQKVAKATKRLIQMPTKKFIRDTHLLGQFHHAEDGTMGVEPDPVDNKPLTEQRDDAR
ncbi:reverse transcriptase [Penicillium taxi]|uniref:reverse transcriptase n=1 Tax=Penicillium taxi TaxID=168475 RepID=UPI0025453A68|nr:reverse transcriptase [Penicillium taxi]KAJ5888875.1 reverse transcriptase [Penicillium taxi]